MAVLAALVAALCATPAFAVAPHVADPDASSCAMCHRSHTSASDAPRFIGELGERGGTALLGTTSEGSGDTELCYTCHGVESLGSDEDVQTDFVSASAHTLSPGTSAFGPAKKDCSTCHDSHGSSRDASGNPLPGLLRVFASTGPTAPATGGDQFCATCHKVSQLDMWDGLDVWRETAHSKLMTAPVSGTGIQCLNCHAQHGSSVAPMIAKTLTPPGAPTTVTVTANDRQLCLGCHEDALRTYAGDAGYAQAGHALSTATVEIAASWADTGTMRPIGECQNCHDPMGRSDGDGGALPRMMTAHESDLCLTCHKASGVALDMAQFKFPAGQESRPEIAMVWDPEQLPEVFSMLSVFSQETTTTVPKPLIGPREWDVQAQTGNISYGDVDGDGAGNLIVADTQNDLVRMFTPDPMGGLVASELWLTVTPSFVEVADLVLDPGGLPEVAVVTRDATAPHASELRLFRLDAGALVLVGGPYSVGDDVTGLASGDVTGTNLPDLVITSAGDQALRIISEATSGPEPVVISAAYPTRSGPRGPSIGDAWDGAASENEILIANSDETTGTLSVFDGDGQELAAYDATATAGASAYDTVVGDITDEYAGSESVVALRHPTGSSSVQVYRRAAGGGLVLADTHTTGTKFNTASLSVGDVDADNHDELVVGNAGYWGFGEAGVLGTSPSVQVFSLGESGAGSVSVKTLRGGGAELAGGDPDVLAVNLGALAESGHPHEGVSGAHVSTETAGFAKRHSECVDCHNPHESTSTVSAAPYVPGTNKGTWGASVSFPSTSSVISYTEKRGVEYEYELCFKCHSGWTRAPGSAQDIASQFDTRSPSFHGIAFGGTPAEVPTDTFVTGGPAWNNDSIMLCTRCHTNADKTEPQGPHSSPWSPMLSDPYSGVDSDDPSLLCYECHKRTVYATGTDPENGGFFSATLPEPKLHKLHVLDRGFTCVACHVTHGSSNAHLIRPGMDWKHYDTGGACFTPCHPGAVSNVYSRTVAPPSVEITPTAYSALSGTTIVSGGLAQIQTQDGDYLVAGMTSGTTPGLNVEFAFAGVAGQPIDFNFIGRYMGQPGNRVHVEIYNYSTGLWVDLGRLPNTTVDSEQAYVIPNDPEYVSGGNVRVRLYRAQKGYADHRVYIDQVWLTQ